MSLHIDKDQVLAQMAQLPAFPRVVSSLLEALDDEGATIGTLVHHVESDPVVTARVLSLANSVVTRSYPGQNVTSVETATSMIGVSRIREIVLAVSLAEFVQGCRASSSYWEHSVVVGVCTQELARHIRLSQDYAFVAGLLHDIGQLWMASFYPQEFSLVRQAVIDGDLPVIQMERQLFGVDHGQIGAWMVEYWGLPPTMSAAVLHHHDPDAYPGDQLVAVTHVGEVLANALDLADRPENQVISLSAAACATVGIDWNDDLRYLFGKIEARSQHAIRLFR